MFCMEPKTCCDLSTAIREGNLSAVHELVQAGADAEEVIIEGRSSLHFATWLGNEAIVRYLVKIGGDVNKADLYGVTPLMTACAKGLIGPARFLIQSGANVNAVSHHLESPLMYLFKGKFRYRETRRVICSGPRFFNFCHLDGTCDCLDIAKHLVEAGADINLVDKDGLSPLVGLILCEHYTVASFLIQSGADTNLATKSRVTALQVACDLKHPLELLEMLISAGADVNYARSSGGRTPLMTACYSSCDKVKALLRAGALVNATDFNGDTALKYAVLAKNPSMIEILAKAGSSIGEEQHLAVIIGHGESIQALVTNGALPRAYGLFCLKDTIDFFSSPYKICPSDIFTDKFLVHLNALGVRSLTPFLFALIRRDTVIARYFVRNLFLHPLDILLLQDLQKKRSMLEDIGLNTCLSPLISQPWSLFNLSFLCVSFAVGFCPDREERILLTGLPASLHRMLLYRDKAAFIPVKDWANLDPIL